MLAKGKVSGQVLVTISSPKILIMIINLNGEKIEFHGKFLSDFITQQQLVNKTGIAVAVNDSVIPKTKWNKVSLNDEDRILIITATQGG